MSQMPPPGVTPQDFAPIGAPPRDPRQPQSRTNGWAIASLVSGLLGCVPFVTGVVAVVTGVIGLRKANDPRYTGRGLAIGGLVLGALSILCWAFFWTAILGIFSATSVPRQLAQDFVKMASDGAVDAAMEHTASNIGRAEMEVLVMRMEPWGEYQDLTSYSSSINVEGGVSACHLKGTATFANGEHSFEMTLIKQGGAWKVSGVEFD